MDPLLLWAACITASYLLPLLDWSRIRRLLADLTAWFHCHHFSCFASCLKCNFVKCLIWNSSKCSNSCYDFWSCIGDPRLPQPCPWPPLLHLQALICLDDDLSCRDLSHNLLSAITWMQQINVLYTTITSLVLHQLLLYSSSTTCSSCS